MSSNESMHDDACQPQSPVSDTIPWDHAESMSSLPTGQLSPISTGMDVSSSGPSTHDTLAIPKLEPLDEEFNLDDVTEAPAPPTNHGSESSTHPKQKRPRGRPRKHPLSSAVNTSKVTKGRSKTGCITCRKRKKKCDEAKPRCMNCEKNAVVCEGYHEKKLWRSGKDKAVDDRPETEDTVVFHMQPLFHGVVTVEDRLFWKHYYVSLSNVLTVEGEAKNAFKDIILPLANQHQGVMHSVLAMSSKHIDYDTPYGAKLLQQNLGTTREALQSRSDYHHKAAMDSFYADIQRSADEGDIDQQTILSARYAQILCLLIGTLIEGNPHGEHRVHLRGYQLLIQQNPPEDPTYLAFITEFFQYHIYADELVRHPGMSGPRLTCQEWTPPASTESPRLLGVADGLFQYLPQIATIKDTIRRNIYHGAETRVDYPLLWRAQEIQEAIEQWSPTRITAAVEESLTMMEGFKPFDPALTLLLIPCQIIGAACFDHAQQERLRGIVRQVRGYTGLRNCDRTSEVLEEIWRLMDEGDWLSAWDWQGVARNIGADFLCT
ncbi:hypothetical protein ACHAQA_009813 [Verticillium albo-atrum]